MLAFTLFKKVLFKNNAPRKESGMFLKNTLAAGGEWIAGEWEPPELSEPVCSGARR